MAQALQYLTECHGGGEHLGSPGLAVFEIDQQTAEFIVRMADLVKVHKIYKIECYDHRVKYFENDPRDDLDDHQLAAVEAVSGRLLELAMAGDNRVSTEADRLSVTDDDFRFLTYRKHCDEEIETEAIPVAELAAHFGIPWGPDASADRNADIVTRLREKGVTSEDLDDLVHDVKADEAATINNSGLAAQVAYLVEAGATADIDRLVEQGPDVSRAWTKAVQAQPCPFVLDADLLDSLCSHVGSDPVSKRELAELLGGDHDREAAWQHVEHCHAIGAIKVLSGRAYLCAEFGRTPTPSVAAAPAEPSTEDTF